MTDDFEKQPDEELETGASAEDAEEGMAQAELDVEGYGEDLYAEEEAQVQIEAALAEAHQRNLGARAWWSLVHPELVVMLLANCFFFAGALVAWDRTLAWDANPVRAFTGLETIRGAVIFALSIYGFWTLVFNIWYRQLKIWPFLINGLIALWVGIGGILATVGSARWDGASAWLEKQTSSYLDVVLAPLSSIAPGFWLLTAGGALVLITLLKGIMGGRAQVKAQAREGAGKGRRRR